jgi:hypothetical protein
MWELILLQSPAMVPDNNLDVSKDQLGNPKRKV